MPKAKYYGRSKEAAEKIVEAFRTGNVPEPLAQVYIDLGRPMDNWSGNNQFIQMIWYWGQERIDVRGPAQWREVGREVKESEKYNSSIILRPVMGKFPKETEKDDGTVEKEWVKYIKGFAYTQVWNIHQTEGDPLPEDQDPDQIIQDLPLLDVAEQWGLDVKAYSGRGTGALGYYSHGRQIGVGVENLSTWAHELIHAADDKLGNLKERGQHWKSETVAEVGGATLLTMLGYGDHADVGGAWEYVQRYAKDADIDAATAASRVLDRICQAIDLILETAMSIENEEVVQMVPA